MRSRKQIKNEKGTIERERLIMKYVWGFDTHRPRRRTNPVPPKDKP